MVRKRKGADPTNTYFLRILLGADPTNTYFLRILLGADRGMISAETMAELEARRLLYILGVRERTDKLVRGADCTSRSATF